MTFKFTPIQQQWIDALKSGDYTQTTKGVLFDGKSYCCLGVAARLMAGEPNYDSFDEEYKWDGDNGILSDNLAHQLGLSTPDGAARFTEIATIYNKEEEDYIPVKNSSLAELNDAGYSFTVIADLLTAHPEIFFYTAEKEKA